MKDVYVIKVKTKPPLSSLYPSERRYSASTVGGLSLVHLGLGILSFLLGTLARSIQGPVLSLACTVPFVSGVLAWRKWYIDKNISIFFYASLFSLIVSIVCGVATIFDIAALNASHESEENFKLQNVFDYRRKRLEDTEKRFIEIIQQNLNNESFFKDGSEMQPINCNETFLPFDKFYNCTDERIASKLPGDEDNADESSTRTIDDYLNDFQNRVLSFFRDNDASYGTRTNFVLDINVLVTCVLEISWSLISVKISLRGMRNDNKESKKNHSANSTVVLRGEEIYSTDNNNVYVYDDNLRNFGNFDNRRNSFTQNSNGPRLPLPESNREFRERVERFLANQAAHRIVEGSCS